MPVHTAYRVKVDAEGLRRAPEIYSLYITRHLEKLGYYLQGEIRDKQREDTGAEKRRTRFTVRRVGRGGLTHILSVYNTSIQAAVDETGAKPHFPPYRAGSRLFKWVSRKGLATETVVNAAGTPQTTRGGNPRLLRGTEQEIESISFLIARAQARRGLPGPDRPRPHIGPFGRTLADERGRINGSFALPFSLASSRINATRR